MIKLEFKLSNEFNNQIIELLKSLQLCNDKTIDSQIYTLNHKQAFMANQLIYRKQLTKSGILHDVDKLVLYSMLPKEDASRLHRDYAHHHVNNINTDSDIEDCIIDYECARFTKTDKPLNAYNTVMKYHPDSYDKFKATLERFNLDSPIDANPDFTPWERLKSSSIQYLIDINIEAIKKIYNDRLEFWVVESVRNFYAR